MARISHIDDDGEVVLDRAQLKTATITDARISAVELTAEGLSTSGPAEFGSNVHIEGSLTVRGTVSGSGPYYDSSDRRFKTNISTISGALDMVSSLRGVRIALLAFSYFIFLFMLYHGRSLMTTKSMSTLTESFLISLRWGGLRMK